MTLWDGVRIGTAAGCLLGAPTAALIVLRERWWLMAVLYSIGTLLAAAIAHQILSERSRTER